MDFQQRASEINELIQSGRSADAAQILSELNPRDIKQDDLPLFAQLAWRANESELGLRALAKYVRADLKASREPTVAETAEYAACLTRIGAHTEATLHLEQCDPRAYPRVLFYRAALKVAKWEYDGALPLLRDFIAQKGVTPYENLVARINIAEALVVTGEGVKAHFLLRELLHTTSVYQYRFATAKVLELAAQNAIQRNDLGQAEQMLKKAEELLSDASKLEPLFVSKFKLYLKARRHPQDPALPSELHALIERARSLSHYETVRDLEAFLAVHTKDEARFQQVYAGTPYEAFKRKMADAWPAAASRGADIVRLGPLEGQSKKKTSFFGQESEGKPTLLVQRTLAALLRDLFRPAKVPTIFAELYPGEMYRFESSPLRVRQAVKRTRQWLEQNCPDINVNRNGDGFSLAAVSAMDVELSQPANPTEVRLDALKKNFGADVFSLQKAGEVLAMSPRSVLRLLEEPLKAGSVEKSGSGPRTRYRFCA